MEDRNKELLGEVIENRTQMALDPSLSADERKAAYAEAMGAIDRATKISELEASRKEAKKNRILKWVEFGIGAVVVPVVLALVQDALTGKRFKELMVWEKDDSFTSTPGKSYTSSYCRNRD